MSEDADFDRCLNFADCLLDEAESLFAEGKTEDAAQFLQDAADELSKAGASICMHIPPEDLEKCDSLPVKVLRKVAEAADVLPDSLSVLKMYIPNIEVPLPDRKISPLELPGVLKGVFEAEPKAEGSASVLEAVIGFVTGHRSMREMIFADDGIYSSLADTAAPYLIAGASYISGDAEKAAGYEDSIPEMLNGPVKHLAELFLSLLTSAFFAGILILLVKRFVTHKKGNIGFAAGMLSLIASNFPLLVSGLREASTELRNFKNIAFS